MRVVQLARRNGKNYLQECLLKGVLIMKSEFLQEIKLKPEAIKRIEEIEKNAENFHKKKEKIRQRITRTGRVKSIGESLKVGSKVWTLLNGHGKVVKIAIEKGCLVETNPFIVLHEDGEVVRYTFDGKRSSFDEKRVLYLVK